MAKQETVISPEMMAAIIAELAKNGTRVGTTQVAETKAAPKERRNTVPPKVVVNVGSPAEQYGHLTIGKAKGNGFIPGNGLDVDQVAGLIKDLRAAEKEARALLAAQG